MSAPPDACGDRLGRCRVHPSAEDVGFEVEDRSRGDGPAHAGLDAADDLSHIGDGHAPHKLDLRADEPRLG